MAVLLTFSSVGHVFAAEERELTNDEKAAFIVRDEWTGWVRDFTASLSELDKNATAKIYEDMDFYDMQYRFTEKYKKVPEYLDEEGKPTQKLKDMIKEKRKEINKRKTETGGESSSYTMIDWDGVSADSWMSKLPNNRYLNDINIPGVANADMAFTEAQATSGISDAVEKARRIALYCRQSSTVYPNLQVGFRAFDYGLSYRATTGTETPASFGYSFTPTSNYILMPANMVNQLGTGSGNYAASDPNTSLVKELQEMVRYLISFPTETIVVPLRYITGPASTGTPTEMATLIKEVIEKQTYPLVDGEKNNVSLKDFVYTGTSFPKLKDVRKKIVIVSRMSALNIGIPLYKSGDSTYTSLVTNGSVVDGVSMYTENKEFHYTAAERVSHITGALDIVTTKNINITGKKGSNGAFINAEGYKQDNTTTTAFVGIKPSAIATQVNKAIKAYDFTQGKLIGMLMIDFADYATANGDLAPIIFKTNP